jgi:CubicO group peptidase (beta-lactamase class C family)
VDLVLGLDARWGAGFLLNSDALYGPNPEAFGHSGWGGSFAFADPRADVAMAYAMNQMSEGLRGDPRAMALIGAVYAALG